MAEEIRKGRGYQGWPWRPFVNLSLMMALLPGFLLGGAMVIALLVGDGVQNWYLPSMQAHGHAQLMGWGGAMILGVLLYFLPRLRGTPLAAPEQVPLWFWIFAGGLTLRVVLQSLGPLLAPGQSWLPWGLVAASAMELAAVTGLITVLVRRPRSTRDQTKPATRLPEVGLFILTAGLAMVTGLVFVLLASVAAAGDGSMVLSGLHNRTATNLLVYGFITTVSVGMTARLFPMFARTGVARVKSLRLSGALFLAAVLLLLVSGVYSLTGTTVTILEALWRVLVALGIVVGGYAVRVFEPRRAVPKERETEYVRATRPVTAGGTMAYGWALLTALLLLLTGLQQLGLPTPLAPLPGDAALHAAGAGFMTVLIFTVAPVMLPGFAGARPVLVAGQLWLLLALGNAAALLRTAPHLSRWFGLPSTDWSLQVMAASGAAGMVGVVLLSWMLWRSWRSAT